MVSGSSKVNCQGHRIQLVGITWAANRLRLPHFSDWLFNHAVTCLTNTSFVALEATRSPLCFRNALRTGLVNWKCARISKMACGRPRSIPTLRSSPASNRARISVSSGPSSIYLNWYQNQNVVSRTTRRTSDVARFFPLAGLDLNMRFAFFSFSNWAPQAFIRGPTRYMEMRESLGAVERSRNTNLMYHIVVRQSLIFNCIWIEFGCQRICLQERVMKGKTLSIIRLEYRVTLPGRLTWIRKCLRLVTSFQCHLLDNSGSSISQVLGAWHPSRHFGR